MVEPSGSQRSGSRNMPMQATPFPVRLRRRLAGVLAASLLGACTVSMPVQERHAVAVEHGRSLGDEIAIRAIGLVGRSYRYGGADLDGFDCSGLVLFIHEQLGLRVPRTAAEQHKAAQAVARGELQPGDLLFFRTRGSGISHVGVYVGEHRFVHAPQSGRLIELRSIDDTYYGRHLVAAGRLWAGG